MSGALRLTSAAACLLACTSAHAPMRPAFVCRRSLAAPLTIVTQTTEAGDCFQVSMSIAGRPSSGYAGVDVTGEAVLNGLLLSRGPCEDGVLGRGADTSEADAADEGSLDVRTGADGQIVVQAHMSAHFAATTAGHPATTGAIDAELVFVDPPPECQPSD